MHRLFLRPNMRNISVKNREYITHKRLTELLVYDKDSGVFTWRIKHCRKTIVGTIAGHQLKKGYRQIRIDRTLYPEHRLAWFYTHKEWPYPEVDHINRDKSDNRMSNLRISMPGAQQFNTGMFKHNSSGIKGVSFHKNTGTWRAYIQVNGKFISLGCYKTIEEAEMARKNKELDVAAEIERQLQGIAPIIFGEPDAPAI